MTVAALYDIHGNLPALEAVLAEVSRERVDEIVVGGDVLPGPFPRETIALLTALEVPVRFVHGNGDLDVLTHAEGGVSERVPEGFRDGLSWVAERLTAEQSALVATWPRTVSVDAALGDILFCHATPRDENEIFTKNTPEELLRPLFEPTGADVVVCGHTHMQFDRTVGSVRVVNAGSVGMPFGDPGAYWLLIDDEIRAKRTKYDYGRAFEQMRATGFPQVGIMDPRNPISPEDIMPMFDAAVIKP